MNLQHYCQPMVALIPVRAWSKRVPGKNLRTLNGHYVLEYSLAAALQSGVFAEVFVCTDSPSAADVAYAYGAKVILREPVSDSQPDIVWVKQAVRHQPKSFAILRPTSPFRTADTIRRAYWVFTFPDQTADSVRAVEPVKQHPGKMWTWEGPGHPIKPYVSEKHPDGTPWHSSPTQSLPPVYVQNSSLEMAWTANVELHGTISGRKVAPFFTVGVEGLSIDTEADWQAAERLARDHPEWLPSVDVAGVSPVAAGERPTDPGRAVSR